MDPPIDRAHPARMAEGFRLESDGSRLNAILYEASGAGPHPTALLLHGFPGNERNLDLAQALRRAGWNVAFFHYRGSWGSGGRFSFGNVLDDVAAVVEQLRDPATATAHRIDPARIALVGHSMGGFAALVAGAELPQVECVVSLAGANLGLWQAAIASPEGARRTAETLEGWGRGPIAGIRGDLLVEEVRENAQRFDTTAHADALAEKRVLLVVATRDEVLPRGQHHDPLVAALQARGARHLQHRELDADHAFSDQRIALARTVVEFLDAECAGGS